MTLTRDVARRAGHWARLSVRIIRPAVAEVWWDCSCGASGELEVETETHEPWGHSERPTEDGWTRIEEAVTHGR